jgi:hypothetical protein
VALSPFSALKPGTTVFQTPTGTSVSTIPGAANPLAFGTQLQSYMPFLLIGGGVLLLVMIAGRSK